MMVQMMGEMMAGMMEYKMVEMMVELLVGKLVGKKDISMDSWRVFQLDTHSAEYLVFVMVDSLVSSTD
jgi:hypothetical protein